MHLKRSNIKNFWAVPKKGTKYVAVSDHDQYESIPLIVVMRDIIKIVGTKKELKKALKEKLIKINGKEIRETNYPVSLFDVLTLVNVNKHYRAILSDKKKMIFEETSDKDSKTKVYKVLNKKILPKKIIQINLTQGKNILTKEKVSIGDSIILNIEDNKIVKVIPLEKGKHVFVIDGKHMGSQGKIEDIMDRGGKKIAKISVDSERINVWIKNLIVIEK